MPLSTGTVLNNRYRIVGLLGQGGFGAVYRAWDMEMKAPCAVKENLDLAAESQRQFEREARMLFNLRHSGLPKVYGSFTLAGAGQYLVMDFIEGEDLQQMLDQQGGALPLADVLGWIGEVCDALAYMHSRQPPIIHRDIKPANIKVTPDGEAVLVDFGIAKEFDPGQKTFTGARAYTPGYASPEQQGGKGTDALSDIYALGATTYALLTGLVPPSATDIISEIAPPPEPVERVNPDVPARVSRAIEAAMQIPRSQRTSSVGAFKGALNAGKAPPPVGPAPPAPVKKTAQAGGAPPSGKAARASAAPSRASRNWLPWVGGALLVLLLMVVVWVIGSQNNDNNDRRATQTAQARAAVQDQTAIAMEEKEIDAATEPTLPTDTPEPKPTLTHVPTSTATFPPAHTPTATGLPQIIKPGSVPMALVSAGEFIMGSEDGDSDESPVHEVYLDDYYIDVYEVTNAQFAECVEDGDCDSPGCGYYEDEQYANHPGVCINWFQAQAYCEWRGARLPTDAEWEKAARGGLQGRLYPWGDESPVCDPGVENGAQFSDCSGQIVPVGTFSTNGYGLYDMAGNVWEWVADWYDAGYYDNTAYENPQGPASGSGRVLRGGSWNLNPGTLRTASRAYFDPTDSDYNIGFRCARSP